MYLLGLFVSAVSFPGFSQTGEDVAQLYKAREKVLIGEFQKDELWRSQNDKKKLLELLKEARTLRSPRLAPILTKHIEYDSQEGVELPPRMTFQDRFPVCGFLCDLGILGVPSVMERLRTVDGKRESNLLLMVLVETYDQGGFGKQLARKRIELEAERCKGKERERLNRALKHSMFK
jgi:hypothetical protein